MEAIVRLGNTNHVRGGRCAQYARLCSACECYLRATAGEGRDSGSVHGCLRSAIRKEQEASPVAGRVSVARSRLRAAETRELTTFEVSDGTKGIARSAGFRIVHPSTTTSISPAGPCGHAMDDSECVLVWEGAEGSGQTVKH